MSGAPQASDWRKEIEDAIAKEEGGEWFDEMIEAGASALVEFEGDLGKRGLAKEVYLAMEFVRRAYVESETSQES